MPEPKPAGDGRKAIGVVFVVALVCGTFVSLATVVLEPFQAAHREAARHETIAELAERVPGMAEWIGEGEARLELVLVDLASGTPVSRPDPLTYDPIAAAADPATAVKIPKALDRARLGARSPFAPVHLLLRDERPALVILPVSGRGYGGVMRGYLALSADGETVVGFTIVEHRETPGLGARIADPDWQASWAGRRVRDAEGRLVLRVSTATPAEGADDSSGRIDVLTGATRTGDAVNGLLAYWLGEHGFGPFLARLAAGEVGP